MAALNPEIIKDTAKLISLYKKNPAFRARFDNAVKQNVNITYNYRPLKLYFEVLASTNSPKYKDAYHQVRRLVRHDNEGIIGKTFMGVTPKDILYLDQAAKKAESKINATDYSDDELKEINKIEETVKDPSQKREAHQKRIEAKIPEKLKEEAKQQTPEEKKTETETEPEKKEEIIPGSSPENKKSYNPASQEERDRLKVALLPKEEIPKNAFISPAGKVLIKPTGVQEETPTSVLVGPSGEPIRNIYPEEKEPEIEIGSEPIIYQPPTETRYEPSGYSQPSTSLPNIPTSRLRNFASGSKKLFSGGAKAGGVVAKGAGRAAGAAVKVGAGAAAKLGASAVLGATTGGISLLIGLVTSGDEIKKLFKLIFWIVIGLIAFIVVMFVFQRGEKMNSLLPPYDIPTMDSVNPVSGGDVSSCSFYRSGDSTTGSKFKISEWPILINDVATKVGIPPSILAAILRVECGNCFASDNPDYVKGDYDSHTNGFAYGVMQFYPPTFESVFNSNKANLQTNFGKTSVKTTVDPQDNMAPANILRIYSIKDSLTAAAYKIKADAGMDPPYTKEAIDNIIKAYFTKCEYTQGGQTFNYCNDVWKSYQNCQPTAPPPTGSFVFYCQSNPIYQQSNRELAVSGCGPTTMAMILSSFGNTITPKEMDAIFMKNGWRDPGMASSMGTAIDNYLKIEKKYDIRQISIGKDGINFKEASDFLNNGYYIIGSTPNHIFAIDSADEKNKSFHYQDPDSGCREDISTRGFESASSPWRNESWYYAYAVKPSTLK